MALTNVEIVFWKYQKNKKGESPIFIRIIEDRKSRYVKTGLTATEEDWDFDKNRFKTKYRKSEDLKKAEDHSFNNELIDKKLREVESLVKTLIQNDNLVSSEQVKQEIVKAKNISKFSVLSFIDHVVEDKMNGNKVGTAGTYKDLKRAIKKFLSSQNKEDISFKELGISFLKKFEDDFRSRGALDTAISFYMRTLRAVFNRAIEEGVCKKDVYPFNNYKISELNTRTIKRAIRKEDVDKIKGLELDVNSRLIHSRNYFLFSYYNRGINFSDIASIKWGNITNNRLSYVRLKTHKPYNMLLLEPSLEILKYYKINCFRGLNNYIFPILDMDKHASEVSIKNRIHKILAQTNQDLKILGEKTGLSIPLTTYVARHTYATVMKKSGVSTSIISESLGHDTERTTQIYLDSFENDILDEASKNIL